MDMPPEEGWFSNDAVTYSIDLYSTAPDNIENPLPPAGEYNLTLEFDPPVMTFSYYLSQLIIPDGPTSSFEDGTIIISYEGENMLLDGTFTDKYGYTHHITFNGPMQITNNSSWDPGTDGYSFYFVKS